MATQGTGQADPYPVATPAEPEWLTRKPADARSGESRVRGYESKLIGFAAVVIFLAVWQGIGVIRAVWPEGVVIGPFTYVAPTQLFLPTPVEIGQAFGTYARDPKFGRDILTSGQALSFGSLLAAFTAIPLGVVVGQAIAAQCGVGQRMFVAGATFQSSKVFAGLMLIAGAGMLMTFTLQWLERRFDAWRPRPN